LPIISTKFVKSWCQWWDDCMKLFSWKFLESLLDFLELRFSRFYDQTNPIFPFRFSLCKNSCFVWIRFCERHQRFSSFIWQNIMLIKLINQVCNQSQANSIEFSVLLLVNSYLSSSSSINVSGTHAYFLKIEIIKIIWEIN